MSDTDFNTLFQQAVDSYDKAYLDAENAIYAQGDTARQALLAKQGDTNLTAFAGFVAATLADAMDGANKTYTELDAAITALAAQVKDTPLGTPPADIVSGTMSVHSKELSDLLALHLVKETEWPSWRALGAIIYLGYYATSPVLPALEQFCADLKAGKHTALGGETSADNEAIIEQLDEAVRMITIVIKEEAKKTEGTQTPPPQT